MGFALGAAAIFGGTAAYSADKQRKASHQAMDLAKVQADKQAVQEKQIADDQLAQAQAAQQQLQENEAKRIATQQTADAENRRQLADAGTQALAVKEPNVQLATTASTDGVSDQRRRRAAFRPDYASGINLG